MRRLFMRCGPVAHLSGSGEGPLCGEQMIDESSLVHPPGVSIMTEGSTISRLDSTEEMMSEFAPWCSLESKVPSLVGRQDGVEVWDVAGRAVIPGLVDAHNHLIWGGERAREVRWRQMGHSYSEIAAMGGGIRHTVLETRGLSHDQLVAIGQYRLQKALANGTTHMEVKSGYALETTGELALLEAAQALSDTSDLPSLDLTWLGAHDIPPSISDESISITDYVDHIINEQLPAVVEQGLARSADVFCEPGWFGLEATEDICRAASQAGLSIRLHVDEFTDGGGMALAAELGADTADHAYHSSADARAAAAAAGTLQGFLPGTPHVMGDEMPPMAECIEQDQPFTIATDHNPNCNILSLPFIGSLAVQRGGLDPLAALSAVTRNAASGTPHPSGDPHGQISVGARADINILSSSQWESWCQLPGDSPFAMTILGGEPVNQ